MNIGFCILSVPLCQVFPVVTSLSLYKISWFSQWSVTLGYVNDGAHKGAAASGFGMSLVADGSNITCLNKNDRPSCFASSVTNMMAWEALQCDWKTKRGYPAVGMR